MAAKNRSKKAREASWPAQGERYVKRLLDDQDLRSSLADAYAAARNAYTRLGNGKGATHALFEDAKLQRELLDAANALREASSSLMEPAPKPARRRRRGRRTLGLILVGAALALILSADLRSKVLDMLFGAEEEFDYTTTTAPASPAPASVPGS